MKMLLKLIALFVILLVLGLILVGNTGTWLRSGTAAGSNASPGSQDRDLRLDPARFEALTAEPDASDMPRSSRGPEAGKLVPAAKSIARDQAAEAAPTDPVRPNWLDNPEYANNEIEEQVDATLRKIDDINAILASLGDVDD